VAATGASVGCAVVPPLVGLSTGAADGGCVLSWPAGAVVGFSVGTGAAPVVVVVVVVASVDPSVPVIVVVVAAVSVAASVVALALVVAAAVVVSDPVGDESSVLGAIVGEAAGDVGDAPSRNGVGLAVPLTPSSGLITRPIDLPVPSSPRSLSMRYTPTRIAMIAVMQQKTIIPAKRRRFLRSFMTCSSSSNLSPGGIVFMTSKPSSPSPMTIPSPISDSSSKGRSSAWSFHEDFRRISSPYISEVALVSKLFAIPMLLIVVSACCCCCCSLAAVYCSSLLPLPM